MADFHQRSGCGTAREHCLVLLVALLFTAWWVPVCLADKCSACGGTGRVTCPACKGSGIAGYVDVHGQQGAYGCERCGGVKGSPYPGTPGYGTGKKGSGHITCTACRGTGQVQGASYTPSFSTAPPRTAASQNNLASRNLNPAPVVTPNNGLSFPPVVSVSSGAASDAFLTNKADLTAFRDAVNQNGAKKPPPHIEVTLAWDTLPPKDKHQEWSKHLKAFIEEYLPMLNAALDVETIFGKDFELRPEEEQIAMWESLFVAMSETESDMTHKGYYPNADGPPGTLFDPKAWFPEANGTISWGLFQLSYENMDYDGYKNFGRGFFIKGEGEDYLQDPKINIQDAVIIFATKIFENGNILGGGCASYWSTLKKKGPDKNGNPQGIDRTLADMKRQWKTVPDAL